MAVLLKYRFCSEVSSLATFPDLSATFPHLIATSLLFASSSHHRQAMSNCVTIVCLSAQEAKLDGGKGRLRVSSTNPAYLKLAQEFAQGSDNAIDVLAGFLRLSLKHLLTVSDYTGDDCYFSDVPTYIFILPLVP